MQQSIVDEANEHDLPNGSTEDLTNGVDDHEGNSSSNSSRTNGKSFDSEKLIDSYSNGGLAIGYSVSPAQNTPIVNNVEDISSVPSSFSSAITEIHFQNGTEFDNTDEDLRKDQLVVG